MSIVEQALLQDPERLDWTHYRDELQMRLRDADEVLKDQIRRAHAASLELHEKLAIGKDGELDLGRMQDGSFTVERKDYLSILDRIKTVNQSFARFSGAHRLEGGHFNRSSSDTELIPTMRRLYSEVFEAIRSACACSQHNTHGVCLELEHRRTRNSIPNDQEQVALGVELHLAIGSESGPGSSESRLSTQLTHGESLLVHRIWNSLNVRPWYPEPQPTTNEQGIRQGVRFPYLKPNEIFHRSVPRPDRDLEMSSMSSMPHPGPTIFHALCHVVAQDDSFGQTDNYVLGQGKQKFSMRPRSRADIGQSTTILDALQQARTESARITKWPLWFRLRTAYDISTAFIYLFGTPWLPNLPSLSDFLLLVNMDFDSLVLSESSNISQTFIGQHIRSKSSTTDEGQRTSTEARSAQTARLAILACGCLLAQILRGRQFEELRTESDMDEDAVWHTSRVGRGIAQEIEDDLGDLSECALAVKWCFDRAQHAVPSKGNNQWLRFHAEVVMRLDKARKYYEDVPKIV